MIIFVLEFQVREKVTENARIIKIIWNMEVTMTNQFNLTSKVT